MPGVSERKGREGKGRSVAFLVTRPWLSVYRRCRFDLRATPHDRPRRRTLSSRFGAVLARLERLDLQLLASSHGRETPYPSARSERVEGSQLRVNLPSRSGWADGLRDDKGQAWRKGADREARHAVSLPQSLGGFPEPSETHCRPTEWHCQLPALRSPLAAPHCHVAEPHCQPSARRCPGAVPRGGRQRLIAHGRNPAAAWQRLAATGNTALPVVNATLPEAGVSPPEVGASLTPDRMPGPRAEVRCPLSAPV